MIKALQRAKQSLHPSVEQGLARRHRLAIFALITFLAAAGVGSFFWWQKNTGRGSAEKPAESTQPGKDMLVEQRYEQARQQLLAGRYDVASETFAGLSKEAGNQQPLLNWIRLHRALAASLSRNPSEFEGALAEIENGGMYSPESGDAALAQFFLETAKTLRGNAPVPAAEAKAGDANSFKAFALLLFGLKNFELKDFTQAQQQLDQFIGAQPAATFAWINDYKAIAQKYLDDCRLYAAWKAQPKTAGSAKELTSSFRALKKSCRRAVR